MEPEQQPQQQKSNGALVGSIIVIIILILGGIYLLQTSIKKESLPENTELAPEEGAMMEEDTSGEILDLETELDNIDLESLDAEI
jgi:hypothetical protein